MIYRGRIITVVPNGYYIEVPRMGKGMELFAPLNELAYAAGDVVYVSSADDQFDNIVIVSGVSTATSSTNADTLDNHDSTYFATAASLDNYATNIALGNKLDASAYTAADVKAKLLTVDGAGSAIDADLLDGQHGAYYATATALATTNTNVGNKLDSSAYTAADVKAKLITVDGAGSTIDADLLDGQEGSYYATTTALNNKLESSSYTAADVLSKLVTVDGASSALDADLLDGQHGSFYKQTGVISLFAGSTAPPGTLLCDGSSVSRTTYAALFAVISTTYGSVDGNTFNLPNLKGRVVVGLDAGQTEFDTLGETGGAKSHTLTVAEMPSHTHGGSTGAAAISAQVGLTDSTSNPASAATVDRASSADAITIALVGSSHSHSIPEQGGGAAHNNLQPYITLNYIINI